MLSAKVPLPGELDLEINIKRRDAVEKIYRVRGHNFQKVFFPALTFCAQCTDLMWGLGKQGMRCSGCKMTVHKRCHKLVLAQCPAQLGQLDGGGVAGILERPHDFGKHTYLIPTYCDHDGTMLMGVFNQGYQCKSCDLNVHKECQKLVPATCGVDRLAHALILIQDKTVTKSMDHIKSDEEMELIRKEISRKIKENIANIFSGMGGKLPCAESGADKTKPTRKSKLRDFQLIKTLGEGAFGKVILAKQLTEENLFAIKILEKPQILENDESQIAFSEKNVLALGSKNRFLTRLHSSFQTPDYIFFVMEYLDGGDLMFHLMETGSFPEERARFYSAELVLALQFLHLQGIIYRDLKLENIMLTSEGHIKLADFGMIKENMNDGDRATTFCGTPNYIAPEMLSGLPYGGSVDWWALGILLYQMLTGRSPFDHEDDEVLYKMIQYRQVLIPPSLSPESQDIIKNLLEKNPNNRLGCKEEIGEVELNDHIFFSSINWTELEEGKITPPFKPAVGDAEDANNFAREFTHQSTDLPALKMDKICRKLAEDVFTGFSFYNDNFDN